MRKVNYSVSEPIELRSVECIRHRDGVIANPNLDARPAFYRGKKIHADGRISFEVVIALKGLYHNKCAYCEKFAHDPVVDHHRPKGRVVGESAANQGYYWLIYEWSNLVPSCTDCNKLSAKGAKFPVLGQRNQTHPTTNQAGLLDTRSLDYGCRFNTKEKPLLLHPAFCKPSDHFIFDKTGLILGKTVKGRTTVDKIALDNADLNGWRRKIYEDYLNDLRKIVRNRFRLASPITEEQFEEEIYHWLSEMVAKANDLDEQYILYRKYMIRRMEMFFISELQEPFRKIVKEKIARAFIKLSQN